MRWRALGMLLVLPLVGCGSPPTAAIRAVAAELAPSPAALAQLALHADDARRAAFATADARPLDAVFGGRSLLVMRAQVAILAARGLRREEVADARRVVHSGGSLGQPEVVIEVRARQRLVPVAGPLPWSTVLRQWQLVLERRGETWLVVDDQDLPPPRWWRG